MTKELSCLPVSIYPLLNSGQMSIPQWAAKAREIGFDLFDLGEACIADLSIEQLKMIGKDCVIPFNMLSVYSDFTNIDSDARARSVAEAKEKIAKTAALGGKYIRLPGGPAYKDAVENTDETIRNMCECIEQCIPVANEYGIRILFENDSQPPSWKEPNFCFNVERFQKTWAELKKLDIGFNFDTGNAFFLDDWSAILMPVLDRVESLHITDYNFDGRNLEYTVFGKGTVPIREMLHIISDNGFDGALCMEDTTFQGLEGMEASYKYVRGVCDEIFG